MEYDMVDMFNLKKIDKSSNLQGYANLFSNMSNNSLSLTTALFFSVTW